MERCASVLYPPDGDVREYTRTSLHQMGTVHSHISPSDGQEILEELRSQLEETNVTESSSKRDYLVEGFLPKIPTPSKEYDYRMDQAKTFWMENVNRITGVSDIRTRNSPFKRSSAFSTPISHYLDQSVPHSIENYPNM
ncbi:unnamed protein product [Ranitomeya imitator]|uniref:Uncharacterized protein n=1 Tax=Ranitomeya imitator TaxID=111125 RepID=A0ABN9M3J8_9NEOB|nr:unnamed protein product [Ranitomeya imitator]